MAKERILVVEDAPDISSLLAIYFRGQGYEVMTAMRGLVALKLCYTTPPNLVLLDVNLPDMTGYDIGKMLRQSARTRHIPIIFLTARGEKQDRLKGLAEVGAEYYIVKPFDIEEVHTIVKGTLDRQRRLVHPLTNLPMAELINEQYRALISDTGWALAQLHINGFETFTQAYGAVVGEDVLKFSALLLSEVVNELGNLEDFFGQMVVSPDFIITSTPKQLHAICEKLCERFDAEIGLHYNYKDRRKGYIEIPDAKGEPQQLPLISLSIGVLTSDDGPFYDIRELSDMIEELRLRAFDEARELGRKSYASYGQESSQSPGSGLFRPAQAPPAKPRRPTADQVRLLLFLHAEKKELAFLAAQIDAPADVARALIQDGAATLSLAQQLISLGDNGVLAILPTEAIGPAVDELFSRFEAHPLAQQHDARLFYGYAHGPFPSIDELIAAVASDLIERYPPPDMRALDRLVLFQLEQERPALRQRYEQARQLLNAYSKELSAQRVGIDPRLQAEIDQLTAVVDHDLGGGLTSLKVAIDQALEQLVPTAKQRRAKLAWMARQVVLCTAWRRSLAELGKGQLLQPRMVDIGRWLHTHLPLLCQQLDPQLHVDMSGVASALQAQIDPQPLLAACLHMILAAGKAGARSLSISSKMALEALWRAAGSFPEWALPMCAGWRRCSRSSAQPNSSASARSEF